MGDTSSAIPAHPGTTEIPPKSPAAKLSARAGTRYGCPAPQPSVGVHGSRFAGAIETLAGFSPAYLKRLRRRLESKFTPEPMSGCWLWHGAMTSAGYGAVGLGSRGHSTAIVRAAHRVMYMLERGEIPSCLVLDHRCRNTVCVNPWHLEAVTQKVNCRRGHASRAAVLLGAASLMTGGAR